MKRILSLILALVFVLSLSACGESPENSIIGKWYDESGNYLEILSDNTYLMCEASGEVDYRGEWKYLEAEEFFKFYDDDDIIRVVVEDDEYGSYIEYSDYGVYYRDEFPEEIIKELEEEKREQYLKNTVECPNFVGEKIEDVLANEEYTDNFELKQEWESNSDYEYGIIYEQSEKADKRVYKNTQIILYVSMGQITNRVPDVYGKTESAAVAELKSNGFTTVIVEESSNEVEKGYVVRTEPQRIEIVPEGAEIKVYVSSGK